MSQNENGEGLEFDLDFGDERYSYYRDAWRATWWKIYVLSAALIISLLFNAMQMMARHHPRPIAVTSDARVLTVTPYVQDRFALADHQAPSE